MSTYFLRCRQADAQALVELCASLGALVEHPAIDGQPASVTATRGGCWEPIGAIYRASGATDEDGREIMLPVPDPDGAPYWHANLTTAVNLPALIDSADWGRWFILDDQGQIRAPNSPARIPAGWTPPSPPAPPAVPGSVTMRQARLALLGIGKLATVTTAINSLPSPHKEAAQIEWEYSGTVERHRPFVAMLAPALGLDDAALDALFTAAAKL
jgi:hypothetical protein